MMEYKYNILIIFSQNIFFFYSVASETCFLKLIFFANSNSFQKQNRGCMIILQFFPKLND